MIIRIKTLPILLISILISISIKGQAPDWTRVLQLNTYQNQEGKLVTTDANYAYFAGRVQGPVTFDGFNYTSVGTYDLILTKVDNGGIVQWKKFINAGPSGTISPMVIKVDNNQNMFISCRYTGTITLGNNTITNGPTTNSFLAKFNASGDCLWMTAFESANTYSINYIFRLAIDASGNSFLISATNKLSKFSSTGSLLWEQSFNTGTLQSIAISGSSLFIGGVLTTSTTFGTFTLTPTGSYTGYLARSDLDGVFNLATKILEVPVTILSTKQGFYLADGTSNHPTAGTRTINLSKNLNGISENVLETTIGDLNLSQGALSLSINGDNSVTVGGNVISPTYGSTPVTGTVGLENRYDPGTKIFYLNYEYTYPDGKRTINETLTYKSLQGYDSYVTDICVTSDGKLAVAGRHSYSMILDPVTITKSSTGIYTYVAKCSNNFVFDWVKSSSYVNTTENLGFRVFTDNSGNIYELSQVTGSFSFDSYNVSSVGQAVVRFDPNGNPTAYVTLQKPATDGSFVSPSEKLSVSLSSKLACAGSYSSAGTSFYGNFFFQLYDIQSDYLNELWKKVSSGKSGSIGIAEVEHDNLANTYIKARVLGYCNYFGTVINKDNEVTVISKHDINGNLLWLYLLQDKSGSVGGPSVIIDPNHYLITYGRFGSSLDLGTETLSNLDSNDDCYVIKYTPGGLKSWAVQINTAGYTEIFGIAKDAENNILISGSFDSDMTVQGNTLSSGGVSGVFVLKLDPDGNFLWGKGFPVGGVVYGAIPACDGTNNIYIACDIYNPTGDIVTFGTKSVSQTEDEASILVKFDLYGNAKWVKKIGSVPSDPTSYSWPVDIKTDVTGNIFMLGWSKNNALFGSTTLINPYGEANNTVYLSKINNLGDIFWTNAVYQKMFTNNYGDQLDVDEFGNVYIGGHFYNEITVNGIAYTPEQTNDFYAIKYSGTGTFRWIKTIPSKSSIIRSLTIYKEDVLTVGGDAGSNSSLGSFVINRTPGSNCIVATMGSLNLTTSVPEKTTLNDDIRIYPNPNKGKFYIEMTSGINSDTDISIINSAGIVIKNVNMHEASHGQIIEIDLGVVSKGIYLVKVQNGGSFLVKPVIIN